MLDTIFRGLFDSDITVVISVTDFMLCLGFSLVLGLVMAFAYMYRTRYTKSFVVTLALLPAVVCVVIMLVNGNVGTGVAVAGAFSLVRFRSRSRNGQGNLHIVSCNGRWADCRHGVFGLCCAFYCGHVRGVSALQPSRFWFQKECCGLQKHCNYHSRGPGLYRRF